MPAWVKKSVQKRTIKVTNPTPVMIETDPAFTQEIAACDDKKGYLNIDSMDANITVKLWRHEGARPDLMLQLDASGSPAVTATSSGISAIAASTPERCRSTSSPR